MNRASLIFAVLLALLIPLSLLAGRVWIDPATTPNAALILMELRLPRAVLAVVIGAGLGAAVCAHAWLVPHSRSEAVRLPEGCVCWGGPPHPGAAWGPQ